MNTTRVALLALSLMTTGVTLLSTASAGPVDNCNGIYEIDGCTCKAGYSSCDEGDRCGIWAANTCVQGTLESVRDTQIQ